MTKPTRAVEANDLSDEDRAKILNSRGNAYYYIGAYNRAIADFDESIWLIPNSAVAYFNRGWAYTEKDEYNRAIMDFDEAMRLGGDDANYVRGQVRSKLPLRVGSISRLLGSRGRENLSLHHVPEAAWCADAVGRHIP